MDHPYILYQNASSTVILIDIPHSLEEAQHLSPSLAFPCSSLSTPQPSAISNRRIISTPPLLHPYPSLEPKSAKARARLGITTPSLRELLLRKHVDFALQEIRDEYVGEWCAERLIEKVVTLSDEDGPSRGKKQRKKRKTDGEPKQNNIVVSQEVNSCTPPTQDESLKNQEMDGLLYTNPHPFPVTISVSNHKTTYHIPPLSTLLSGSLFSSLPLFTTSSPSSGFSIITLDPPWPNRSARRAGHYNLSYSTSSIQSLLSSLPLNGRLKDEGFIAVWTTNKNVFRDMVLGPDGLFDTWGMQLVEEWIWIKTTRSGEPICALEGASRRPWEVLLIGRKIGSFGDGDGDRNGSVKRRIIAGVPDLHSRKPGLKGLFERLLLNDAAKGDARRYEALEIFARNLTAGWWGWGDEVLKFQSEEYWVDEE